MDYYLTEQDRNELRALLRMAQTRRANPTLRPSYGFIEDEEHQAPEVYVAKTPASGIPALVAGSAFVSCTGTGTAGNADKPGMATCCLFTLLQESDPGQACLNVTWGGSAGNWIATSAAVYASTGTGTGACDNSPGNGYQIGDYLSLNVGGFSSPAIFAVTGLGTNNSVASVAVLQGGVYSTQPANPVPTETLTHKLNTLRGPMRDVYNFTTQPIPGGVWILIERDKFGAFWSVQGGGGGAGGRMLGQLYKKTYTPNQFTKYNWKHLADAEPAGIAVGPIDALPAYHIDNQTAPGVDLPVPLNVYLNASVVTGAYLLIETMPEWDFCRKTGAASGGFFPGYRVRYRQDTGVVKDMYQILILDLNAVAQDPADPP
jgi:hypothetical protein